MVVELGDGKLEAMAIFNVKGLLVFANQAFYQLFGYNQAETLTGKELDNFLTAGKQDLKSLEWLKEQAYWTGKVTGILKDKSPVNTYLSFYKISLDKELAVGGSPQPAGESRKLDMFMTFFAPRDINKEKKRKLKQFYDQKMETVARMANGMAHDLNNVMTVITGYTDILQETLEDADPVKKSIQLISKAGQRANDFIKQLLVIGKRFPLKNEILNLNILIRTIQANLEQAAGPKSRLKFQLDDELWEIEGDKELLEQILATLVINARENTKGQGQIALFTQNRSVSETSDEYINGGVAQGEYILLSVKDNGEAVSEESLSILFDPFATMKERDKSLNLGLAKAYAVVSQMKGYIFPVSESGKGNIMHLLLPASRSAAGRDRQIDEEIKSQGISQRSPLSILVVEDELDVSHFIKRVLAIPEYNFQISEASNGKLALDLCHKTKSKPDVLITDVVMPYMNGVELYDELKRAYPELKVLFISGYAHTALKVHDDSLNRINFLEKPFTANQLLTRLEAIIGSS